MESMATSPSTELNHRRTKKLQNLLVNNQNENYPLQPEFNQSSITNQRENIFIKPLPLMRTPCFNSTALTPILKRIVMWLIRLTRVSQMKPAIQLKNSILSSMALCTGTTEQLSQPMMPWSAYKVVSLKNPNLLTNTSLLTLRQHTLTATITEEENEKRGLSDVTLYLKTPLLTFLISNSLMPRWNFSHVD